MEAIYIPQLAKAFEQTETVEIQDYLPDLETLTPIQGQLRVVHGGSYLEVSANAETIVTLTCDRCLQQYNHRLAISPFELIWLEEPINNPGGIPLEREVTLEELVETLPPQGYFHPAEWIYEQFCLAIPQRQLCDLACPGIPLGDAFPTSSVTADRRWASLEALKQQISNPSNPN